MAEEMEQIRLMRESRWIKEYATPKGLVRDSKYRTFQCDADAAEFTKRWREADAAERRDMEAAFTFFPANSQDEMDQILRSLVPMNPSQTRRMREAWIASSHRLTPEQQDFVLLLYRHLPPVGQATRFVGSNRWFRVQANDAGFDIETLVQTREDMPTEDDLARLLDSAVTAEYRHAINIVRACRFLILPEGLSPDNAAEST